MTKRKERTRANGFSHTESSEYSVHVGEEMLTDDYSGDQGSPAIEHLIEIGREKGFVSIDDILIIFPDAERDIDLLEEAYAALIAADIPYIDEDLETEDQIAEKHAEEELAIIEEEENQLLMLTIRLVYTLRKLVVSLFSMLKKK